MQTCKLFAKIFLLSALFWASSPAQAKIVDGTPVAREDFRTGCAFRCPLGLVLIRGVEFAYKNGISEYKKDGGVLVCTGSRRIVEKATVPSILNPLIPIDDCSVEYIQLIGGGTGTPGRQCNEEQLQICLDYQGGNACYEKHCR